MLCKGDITQAFIIEFANKEDRDYYVHEDKGHHAVAKTVGESFGASLRGAQVTDLWVGRFEKRVSMREFCKAFV